MSVEIEQVADGLVDVSRPGQAVARATRSLGEMLVSIRPVAESFLDAFVGMANAPDEIGLEYGLSVSADANLVIATTAAQANFKVTLTWRTPPVSVTAAVVRDSGGIGAGQTDMPAQGRGCRDHDGL